MRTRSRLLPFPLPLLVASVLGPPPASADVFDPVVDMPDCLRVDPSGAIPFDVSVYNQGSGQPHAGYEIRAIFDPSCTDLVQVDAGCSRPTVFVGTLDTAGMESFEFLIGGCCDVAGAMVIEVDPGAVALFPIYHSIGSNDSNGDGRSNLADFVAFQAEFLTASTCHDLAGCDENVQLADFVAFQTLFLNGEGCP